MLDLKFLIPFAFLLGGTISATAQTRDLISCEIRAHGNPVQSQLCAQKELVKEDARLNKAYIELKKQMSREDFAHIRNTETRWLAERDYRCKEDAETTDISCVLRETSTRADELERLLRF